MTEEKTEAVPATATDESETIPALPDLPAINGRTDWLGVPKDFAEAIQFAELIAGSNIVPKEFRGNPGDVLIVVQMGSDVGLSWAQALQNIAVINGKPSMYGDAVLAVVRSSGKLDSFAEWWSDDMSQATCRAMRVGDPVAVERSFSVADAKAAGLTEKPGPWKQYRARMLQMRARAWTLRDLFPDVLKGISVREEAEDLVTIDGETGEVVKRSRGINAAMQTAGIKQPGQEAEPAPIDASPEELTPEMIRKEIEGASSSEDIARIVKLVNLLEPAQRRELGIELGAAAKRIKEAEG